MIITGISYHGIPYMIEGTDLFVRPITLGIHNPVFKSEVISIPSTVTFTFFKPIWDLVIYVGSDFFNHTRFPILSCYKGVKCTVCNLTSPPSSLSYHYYIGGDGGPSMTTFGPEKYIQENTPDPNGVEPTDRDRMFQYLVCMQPREYWVPNYVPSPIIQATLNPGGSDVFIGLVQARA